MTRKSKDSLLLAEPAEVEIEQLDLPGIPEEYLAAAERAGEFTGDRLFERKPDVYKAVIVCLGMGMGQIRIGKKLGVSPNTVRAVRRREGVAVDIEKREAAFHWGVVRDLCAERIIEKLEDDEAVAKTAINHLAVTGGIATEKSELLSGGATSRVAHAPAEASNEDFDAYLASLRRVRAVEGEDMGKPREKRKQKALAGPSPGPAAAPSSPPGPEDGETAAN